MAIPLGAPGLRDSFYRHSTSAIFMAARSNLPSDPEFLFNFMNTLPAESDTDDDFDRYLGEEESLVAEHEQPQRSRSNSLQKDVPSTETVSQNEKS